MTDISTTWSQSSSTSQTIDEDIKGNSNNSHNNEQKLLMEEIAAIPVQLFESVHDNKDEGEGKKNKKKEKKEKEPAVPLYKIFRFATPLELFLIIISSILSAGIGAMQPVSTIIFGNFIGTAGSVVLGGDLSTLVSSTHNLILIFVYMGTAVIAGAYITNSLWIIIGERQARRIRSRYVHAIMRQEMGWFDKAEDGSLNTRLAADTQLIQDGISEKFGLLVMCIGQFVAGIIVAFIEGWRIALVLLAVIPLMAGVGGALGYLITKYTNKTQDAYAHAGSVAEQVFSGIRTVYSFSLQKRYGDIYEKKLDAAMKSGIIRGQILGLGFGIFMFILFSTFGLSFWYGTKLTREGTMSGNDVLIAFIGKFVILFFVDVGSLKIN
jgi:ABC-type multidrug transport system fused ATPase/permease subunit